jgi:urease accessory protein
MMLPQRASRLRFERTERGSILVASHAELPLVVQRPLRAEDGQTVIVQLMPAGALFDGDVVHVSVECGPMTDVTLTTASATRLNRCDREQIVFELDAFVDPGATLRILPHELIPFRRARYRQRLHIDLRADASVMLLDIVSPGRSGAAFTYSCLELETDIHVDGALAVRERCLLASDVQAALGGYTHYGSLLWLTDQARADAAAVRLMASDAHAGASALPAPGASLKILGFSAQQLRATLFDAVDLPLWLRRLLPA